MSILHLTKKRKITPYENAKEILLGLVCLSATLFLLDKHFPPSNQ